MGKGVDDLTEAPERRPRRAAFGAVGPVLGVLGLLLLAALIALWLERRPIASHFIDREFAKRGVPARYHLTDLGFGRQRLTDVVIGDPAAPDLVADWIETDTRLGLSGASLEGVRAGHVRARGRLVDGRVSLGALDRLIPAPSGKPFALPALHIDLADGRLRLDTAAGVLGFKLSGQGRLDDGFSGSAAVTGERLQAGGCVLDRPQAVLRIATRRGAPSLTGPVRIANATCAGAEVASTGIDVTATLSPSLDRWQGSARIATAALQGGGVRAERARGSLDFAGRQGGTAGTLDLAATGMAGAAGTASGLAVKGRYQWAGTAGFDGTVQLADAAVAGRWRERLDALDGAAGTPLAPIARALRRHGEAALRRFDGSLAIAAQLASCPGATDRCIAAQLREASLSAASGARVGLAGGTGLSWRGGAGLRVDTTLTLAGGGLPTMRVALAQAQPGAPIRGRALVSPYAADGGRLALAPVLFTATPGGATRIATRVTLSGPLGDGRVDELALPLDARWDGRAALAINPGCATLSFRRIAVSGLALDAASVPLCATGPALLTLAHGQLAGGARLGAVRLAGRLGTTPLALAATGAELRLADRGFALRGIEARLGPAERLTRLGVAELAGTLTGANLAGRFNGAAGQIANVPLLLGDAAGDWQVRGGALALTGALTVSDAAADPRFAPLAARTVSLALAGGRITAQGVLYEPTANQKIADVRIEHALGDGRGGATLAVPGITFTKDFQPDRLTRLTLGVIAEVRGTVTGEGHIDWSAAGVTSGGRFATAGTDLAAAFGPVSGIAGTIVFTDLLALESAPGQVATVKSINPGIEVTDGTIRYRTLAGSRIQLEGARWPFAGGALTLDPSLLDFSAAQARRLTFHVAGAAAEQFLQQFDFQNLDATGIFDGELPMIFDVDGGRIEGGKLSVREGGGGIAYVGAITQKDVGFWGNLAFQALKSLRYRNLTIAMNGPLAGEMITEVRFAGVSQGQGAKSNFLIRRLQRLPFVFNVRIKAPFRGLVDTAQSFYDPKRLISRNLPQLLDEQNKRAAPPSTQPAIQPPASETVP